MPLWTLGQVLLPLSGKPASAQRRDGYWAFVIGLKVISSPLCGSVLALSDGNQETLSCFFLSSAAVQRA